MSSPELRCFWCSISCSADKFVGATVLAARLRRPLLAGLVMLHRYGVGHFARIGAVGGRRRRGRSRKSRGWTPLGLAPHATTLRRTDQVLLDIIHLAERSLYMLTFAAYKIPVLKKLCSRQHGVASRSA